jgi:hypothetical protein
VKSIEVMHKTDCTNILKEVVTPYKICDFLGVSWYSLVGEYLCFEATYCLHLQDIQKLKALCFSETFVPKYQTIRCHNIEDAYIRTANVSLLIQTFILLVTCWSLK